MAESENKSKINPEHAMKATIGALGELSAQGNHKRIIEAASMPGATKSGEQLVKMAKKFLQILLISLHPGQHQLQELLQVPPLSLQDQL